MIPAAWKSIATLINYSHILHLNPKHVRHQNPYLCSQSWAWPRLIEVNDDDVIQVSWEVSCIRRWWQQWRWARSCQAVILTRNTCPRAREKTGAASNGYQPTQDRFWIQKS